MTSTASIGLMTLFLVDLADMYFLSLLGEVELASAVGFGGSVLFFTTSICIGLMIAMSALVSRAIGTGDTEGAKVTAVNVLAYSLILTSVIATLVWFAIPWFLSLLGASGRAHLLAGQYLRITCASSSPQCRSWRWPWAAPACCAPEATPSGPCMPRSPAA